LFGIFLRPAYQSRRHWTAEELELAQALEMEYYDLEVPLSNEDEISGNEAE
jgi:hypothetical protein